MGGGRNPYHGGGSAQRNVHGSFSVGTIGAVTDFQGEIVGQALVLFEGRFVGDRILVDAVFHVTTNEGSKIRDYQFVNEVVYVRIELR